MGAPAFCHTVMWWDVDYPEFLMSQGLFQKS